MIKSWCNFFNISIWKNSFYKFTYDFISIKTIIFSQNFNLLKFITYLIKIVMNKLY